MYELLELRLPDNILKQFLVFCDPIFRRELTIELGGMKDKNEEILRLERILKEAIEIVNEPMTESEVALRQRLEVLKAEDISADNMSQVRKNFEYLNSLYKKIPAMLNINGHYESDDDYMVNGRPKTDNDIKKIIDDLVAQYVKVSSDDIAIQRFRQYLERNKTLLMLNTPTAKNTVYTRLYRRREQLGQVYSGYKFLIANFEAGITDPNAWRHL